FALLPGMARLGTHEPIPHLAYSERFVWDRRLFDPVTHAIAQYEKIRPRWVFIQGFSGGVDGRRSLTHASFVRRYMQNCGTWTSSYRLVLGLLQELDVKPEFAPAEVLDDGASSEEDARWDVVFTRIAALQEYGWHAAIEEML